ncbi:hypothetical protein GOODEAATRI_017740 [Goodea atripinnis]|uniref:Uncharacterized protein n=1 Tax=Goodea atripinnis TaxID=208336 RepID=A0ABV0P5R4_9TELE
MVSLYYAIPKEKESDCQKFNVSVEVIPENCSLQKSGNINNDERTAKICESTEISKIEFGFNMCSVREPGLNTGPQKQIASLINIDLPA